MGKTSDKGQSRKSAKRPPRKASRPRANANTSADQAFLLNLPKPRKSLEELAREQGVKPFTGIENMPPLFESEEEAEAFMKWAIELRASERRVVAKRRPTNLFDE